jgi:ABC-type phosphate transport system substrate-binding protein
MTTLWRCVLLALVLLAVRPLAVRAQAGVFVIANRANPAWTLPKEEVSRLFLLKRRRWPAGQKALVVDQVESSPARRLFSELIHGMDVPSVKSFWQEIVFSGRGDPPPERASDDDVVAFVKASPFALGYVGSDARTDGVKIILVTP